MQEVIDWTHRVRGLAFIAHPYSARDKFDTISRYQGIEVWNGDWDSNDEWSLSKWDELLKAEVNPTDGFCVGIGNSDAHSLNDLGSVRTYLYLPHGLTRNGIREALQSGHAVFSDGPLLVFDLQNCGVMTGIGDFKSVPQNTPVTLNFEWSSNELYGEVNRIEVCFDGHLIVLPARSITGSYSWKIDVSDKAVGSLHYIRTVGYTERGNKCYTNPAWIEIGSPDVEPPTVSITSYPPSYVARRSATVRWTTYDRYTGVECCEVYLNDTLQGMPSTNSWTFDGLVDGTYKVEVTAYDYAGNSGSHSITFKVDTTPPPVPVLKSVPINGNTPTFEWSSVFDPSGVAYTFQIAKDLDFKSLQLTRTSLTTNTYAVTSSEALPSGTYYWHVKVTDGAGNVSWSEIESFEVPTSINWWLWGGIIAVLAVTIGIAAVLYIIRYERRK